MENGDQDMVKGSQISAEVRKALGEECIKSFPWGKRSEGRGRVGMRTRGKSRAVEVEAAGRFVRAPSGNSLLGT